MPPTSPQEETPPGRGDTRGTPCGPLDVLATVEELLPRLDNLLSGRGPECVDVSDSLRCPAVEFILEVFSMLGFQRHVTRRSIRHRTVTLYFYSDKVKARVVVNQADGRVESAMICRRR